MGLNWSQFGGLSRFLSPYSTLERTELPFVFSQPRFETYLRAASGDVEKALKLYEWNLELSAALFTPLQVCEVAMRNGVAEALNAVHGSNWPWSKGFQRSLPHKPKGYDPSRDLQSALRGATTTGQVVADLKFMFWQSMFTVGQDARLWGPHLHAVFPGVSKNTSASVARSIAFADLDAIRRLRNRVAHHEPIFATNISDEYSRIHNVVSWRSQTAAQWMDRRQRVLRIARQRP